MKKLRKHVRATGMRMSNIMGCSCHPSMCWCSSDNNPPYEYGISTQEFMNRYNG